MGGDRLLPGGGGRHHHQRLPGRRLRAAPDLPGRAAAVRGLLRAHRAGRERGDGDRGEADPGCGRRDDPGLRAEPALGRHPWRRAAARRLAVGRCCGRRGGGGPPRRRRARGRDRLAGPVLDRRRGGRALHGPDRADGRRVARPGASALDRLRRHGAGRADPGAADPRRQPERGVGLALRGDAVLLRDHRPGRVRLHLRGAAGQCPAAGPPPAAQPGADRLDHRDPDRRGDDQRADVPVQPVLPGPGHAGVLAAGGRPGDAAGHRRAGGRGASRAPSRRAHRRPVDHRARVRAHDRRVRGGGLHRGVLALRRLPAAPDRHRRRHGALQRTVVLRGDGVGARRPGGGGLGGVQHGAVRRRRGRHRAGSHDLRPGDGAASRPTGRPPRTPCPRASVRRPG